MGFLFTMRYGIRLYVTTLSILALACTGWVYALNSSVPLRYVSAALVFSVIGAVCEMQAYKKGGRNESGSIAFLATLALVVVAPSWITIVAVSLATAFVQIAKKRVAIKAIFNVAQVTL